MDVSTMTGPIWVTLAYCAVYYGFMYRLMRVKIRLHREYKARGETFDRYFGQDREMLVADRVQLNMLEHMPIFLVLLWLHASVVSSVEATVLGGIYVATRALYPFLAPGRMGNDISLRVLYVTFTGYGILSAFAIRIAMRLIG